MGRTELRCQACGAKGEAGAVLCPDCFMGYEEVPISARLGVDVMVALIHVPSDDKAVNLQCPMCGEPDSFTIDKSDESRGYCAVEDKTWVIRPAGMTVTPAPSFQPPDACPDCKAGVPFDEHGRHVK